MYAAPQQNRGFERRKENLYLHRIAELMGTDRQTLNSYGKIKLWEDGPNYQKVVKYVNNSQCHQNIKLTVVNLHRVWRRGDEEDLFDISNRQLLWHGTQRANIPHILNNGFRLPASNGQMFGAGIYFADRITKSSNYSDQDATFLLLCEVGLGKVYSCKQSHNHWTTAPEGFDSVKANGTYVPDWTDNDKYFGSLIPLGKTARCTKYTSHAVNFNEFIVFDPKRIIIRFLVEVNVERVTNPVPLVQILVIPGEKPLVKKKSNLANKANRSFSSTSGTVPRDNQLVKKKTNSVNITTPSFSSTSGTILTCSCSDCSLAAQQLNASYNQIEPFYTSQSYPSYGSTVQPRKPKNNNCVIL